MRRLTETDLVQIIGSTIQGYRVETAKIKQGSFIDSNHYGIILGRNTAGMYVTWEFHLLENDSVLVYWGHYIVDREEALRDYNARGIESPQKFYVTVTETFQMTIEIEADSKQRAEQIVSTDWRRGEVALGPENFAGVEFKTVPAVDPYYVSED